MWYFNHPFDKGHQVLVIRHGQRPEIPPTEFGHALPLTREGEKKSQEVGHKLSKIQWGEIHSSPLIRCEQTASHFLEAAGQKIPIFLSKILGDPGPFVSHPEEAGPIFLKNAPDQIMHQIISNRPAAGMRTLQEGGRLFVNHLKTIQTFPCLMISHDIIIALLCSYFFKTEPCFPAFLDGFCIEILSDSLMIYNQDCQVINPLGKQETSCASKAKSDRSKSGLNDEDHSREARPRRKVDLTQPQQADRLLFAQGVNTFPF